MQEDPKKHPGDLDAVRRAGLEPAGEDDNEDTQTLSLDELGITPPPGDPARAAAGPAPQAPARPTPPPPKPAAPPQEKTERIDPHQQKTERIAPNPEPTARIEVPPAAPPAAKGAQTIESTARWDPQSGTLTPGEVTKILPPEPDDEPELPYSLQPTNLSESTPQVSRAASRVRKQVSAKSWLALGIVGGLAVGALLYFRNWKIDLPVARPQRAEQPPLPKVEGVAPPAAWARVGRVFMGRDEINKPWIVDPATGGAMVSPQSIPADLDWTKLAVVATPPLERFTRLAWLQPPAGGSGATLLVCRDFAFHDAAKLAEAQDATAMMLNWSAELPAGDYPFAPAVADTPDPKVGELLVATNAAGTLVALNPQSAAEKGPVWTAKLDSAPIRAPQPWLDLRGDTARLWLIAPTARSLTILDATTGKPAGSVEWPAGLNPASRATIRPMRLGDMGWGWLISNGQRATAFRIAADGKPLVSWEGALPEGLWTKGEAPFVVTFPDPDAPGWDQFAVSGSDGRTVWINRDQMVGADKQATPATIDANATGRLTAIDLDGDGYWDLAGINGDGNLWFKPGPASSDRAGRLLPWGDQVGAGLDSAIVWQLGQTALVGNYFGRNGRLEQVELALPALTSSNIAVLKEDWDRRHPVD